jgi:hypothetical protein
MDSSTPLILRLPTEILSGILSIVVPSIQPERRFTVLDRKKRKLKNSPFHAVRSTCRTFRWIVDELPFWRDDKFSIDEINLFAQPHWKGRDRNLDAHNVDVLLSDPHLCHFLGRKTGWTFGDPFTFRALVRRIPHFGQCVRYLKLYTYHRGVDIYKTLPDSFPTLTVLDFRSKFHIHFDALPTSLQTLYFGAPLICDRDSGCTNDFPNLDRLSFSIPDANPLTALDFKRMLPFNSKKTLQHLQITVAEMMTDPMPDFALLHQFKNLTTLQMISRILPVQLYQSLIQSPFRLTSFEASAPRISPMSIITLVRLLQSPVLQNLQNLHISFPGGEDINIDDQPVYEEFVGAIVNLTDLETLNLWYYLLHPDWIQLFRKSRRLRSVEWAYFRFGPITIVGHYDDCDLELTLADILSLPQDEVLNVRFDCRDYDRSDIHSGDEFDDDDEEDDDEENVPYGDFDDYGGEEYYMGDEFDNYENEFF